MASHASGGEAVVLRRGALADVGGLAATAAGDEGVLSVLVLGGRRDQLNLPGLQWAELVVRRVQLILDANSGATPSWEGSEHYMGLGKRSKGIAPSLQSHVAARLKEEAEVEKQRQKAREVRKLGRGGKKGKDDES